VHSGDANGFNVPKVEEYLGIESLTDPGTREHFLSNDNDKELDEMSRRILCDAYICFYRNPALVLLR
jgi:hypothetical protein